MPLKTHARPRKFPKNLLRTVLRGTCGFIRNCFFPQRSIRDIATELGQTFYMSHIDKAALEFTGRSIERMISKLKSGEFS